MTELFVVCVFDNFTPRILNSCLLIVRDSIPSIGTRCKYCNLLDHCRNEKSANNELCPHELPFIKVFAEKTLFPAFLFPVRFTIVLE